MAMTRVSQARTNRFTSADFAGARLGHLVGLNPEGLPLVSFEGALAPGVVARVARSDVPPSESELQRRPAVVLMFEDGDPALPIIVGIVRPGFARPAIEAGVVPASDAGRTVEVNGKALVFEGQDEIVFRCGLGSLTIRANGHIVVKGTRLVSRASETNRIRGASVQIN
jgi:hypothetical protein